VSAVTEETLAAPERVVGTEDLQQLEDLFWRGAALAPPERERWLRGIADTQLRGTLGAMLESEADDGEMLGRIGAVFREATPTLKPGQRLGPWRIEAEIGRGGNGVVYLAKRDHAQFELRVAVKVISGLASRRAADQLRRERKLLATLQHPNIARLLDGGETTDGHPYLVMEHVQGEPLDRACDERQYDLTARVRTLAEIAEAVHYAHQHLIVHRDIKPANILLRRDGRPVLLDFGVAKILQEERAGDTQPWLTPAYASPEQLRGEAVSTASDVYGLGVLLFKLVTGVVPERAPGPFPKPSEHAPPARRAALRGDLDAIVQRACAYEPGERYPSAQALVDDLRNWLEGRPVVAARRSWAYVLRKLVRRRPGETALVLALAATLAFFAWRLAEQRDRAERSAREAETVSEFVLDLFRRADPEPGRRPLDAEDLVEFGAQHLQERDDLPPHMRARLGGTLGEIARRLGRPEQASALLQNTLEMLEQAGAPAAERAAVRRQLASALDHRSRYAEAEALYTQALALMKAEDDPAAYAMTTARLGLMQSRQRRFEEGETTLRRALLAAQEALGTGHAIPSEIELYLAELYALADRPDMARKMIDAPIARLRKALRPDDPVLLNAFTIQATVLREARETDAAAGVLDDVLQQRRAVLAEDSWLIASVHNALGQVRYDQGRSIEAALQFNIALEAARRSLAGDDPALATYLSNLGELYEELGVPSRGLPLLREAVAIVQRAPEGQELLVLRYRQNLGRMLLLSGDEAESRFWLSQPIPPNDDSRYRLQAARQRLHLAEWQRRFGDPAQAARLLDELEATLPDLGGAANQRWSFGLRIRAALRENAGDRAAARVLLDRALQVALESRGERWPGTGLVLLQRAELEDRAGDAGAARDWARRAAAVLEEGLMPEAPDLVRLRTLRERLGG
jgi:tetratricopeptide (TPR) repeat protein/predicted Ser/Thr protein kinase